VFGCCASAEPHEVVVRITRKNLQRWTRNDRFTGDGAHKGGRRRQPAAEFMEEGYAQATIWAAWVKVAKAPGTKAVRATMKQVNRINIGGAPLVVA